jgi:hypothetical protein
MVANKENESLSSRCPIIRNPDQELANLTEFNPLLAHLSELRATGAPLKPMEFARGTIQLDGRLDLCKQGLGSEGTTAVLSAVPGTPIRHLLLGTNAIGGSGLEAVASAIGQATTIETVYLGCNGITSETLPILTNAIVSSSVRAVWLKRNPLGADAAPIVADMIDRSQLETLDLVATDLDDQSFEIIARSITRSLSLRHLFLSGNGLTAQSCHALAGWIAGSTSRSLHLSANPIGDEGVDALAEALQHCRFPFDLSISSIGLTDGSANALGRIVAKTERLDLGRSSMARAVGATDNIVGDDGLLVISSQFGQRVLRSLDIRHCGFTDVGATALINALDGDHAVEYLAVGPTINRKIKSAIRQRLHPPTGNRTEWHITSHYR